MNTFRTFFKVSSGDARPVGFGFKCEPQSFNYIELEERKDSYKAGLIKQMSDSFKLTVDVGSSPIKELKLTNQGVLTWEDYWIDQHNVLVDPRIESLNLQKNSLVHFNANLYREHLKRVNVESNPNMVGFILSSSPNVEYVNLSNCPSLTNVNLGNNSKIKAILARNCNLQSQTQERLLRDFRPTLTAKPDDKFSMFRKNYETILDLRGTVIDWSNRRVASKIRLLVCNNWLVLWDNPPPTSIIPPQMYSFFTTNLEESLIREYYVS